MARWGYHAMESDEGLALLQFLGETLVKGQESVSLSDILDTLRAYKRMDTEDTKNTEPFDEADVALAEFCLHWARKKEVSSYQNSHFHLAEWKNLKELRTDPKSLGFLLNRLLEIQADADSCQREYTNFWLESAEYYDWISHIDHLTAGIRELAGQ